MYNGNGYNQNIERGTDKMNNYIRIEGLLDDIESYLRTGEQDVTNKIAFLQEYPWVTDEVLGDIVKIYKDIKANAARNSLKKSDRTIGRPRNEEKIKKAVKMYKDGVRPVRIILEETGVPKSTLYDNIELYWDVV